MKNLFKKAAKNNVTANVQKLDKTQLETVIGGADKGINEAGIKLTSEKGINQSGVK
jgi:hypothetical protein